MTKRVNGDVTFNVGGEIITLRLTIGAMQDIESLYDKSILQLTPEVLGNESPKVQDIVMYLTAMLGRNINDQTDCEYGLSVLRHAGLEKTLMSISECYIATISPDGVPGKPEPQEKRIVH